MGDRENEGGFRAINQPNMAPAATSAQGSAAQSRAASRSQSRAVSIDMTANESVTSASAPATRLQPTAAAPAPAGVESPAVSTTERTSRTPAQDDSAQSEPITRAPSTSSQHSSKDALAAAGYGTRSRNRGAARPNYAEDVEMDFEQTTQAVNNNGAMLEQDTSPMEASSDSPSALDSRQSPAPSTGKRAVSSSNGGWNALNKDTPIPGTSTFSTTPNTNIVSRKRKAAAVANQNITSTNTVAPAAPAPASGRRSGVSSLPQSTARETNMVSFENCNTTLNEAGALVSDDGQMFSANGKCFRITLCITTILQSRY
jgi:hypothetical protein